MKANRMLDGFRALPVETLDRVLPGTVLVLAPHPDDESLGCGGIIAALCAAGRPPVVAVLTDGAGSHPSSPAWPPDRLCAARAREVANAVALLGLPADRLHLMRQPDTRAPHTGDAFELAVAELAGIASRFGCGAILASWEHDPHCDHLAAWLIGRAAAERSGARALAYPVWGWTLDASLDLPDPAPTGWRIDVSAFLPAKARAVAAHETQHPGLIDDDPDGFFLPPEFLSLFEGPFETVLAP